MELRSIPVQRRISYGSCYSLLQRSTQTKTGSIWSSKENPGKIPIRSSKSLPNFTITIQDPSSIFKGPSTVGKSLSQSNAAKILSTPTLSPQLWHASSENLNTQSPETHLPRKTSKAHHSSPILHNTSTASQCTSKLPPNICPESEELLIRQLDWEEVAPESDQILTDLIIAAPSFDIADLWDEVRAVSSAKALQSKARHPRMATSQEQALNVELRKYFERFHITDAGPADTRPQDIFQGKFHGRPAFTPKMSWADWAKEDFRNLGPQDLYLSLREDLYPRSGSDRRQRWHDPFHFKNTSKTPAASPNTMVFTTKTMPLDNIPYTTLVLNALGVSQISVQGSVMSNPNTSVSLSSSRLQDSSVNSLAFSLDATKTWNRLIPDSYLGRRDIFAPGFLHVVPRDSFDSALYEWAFYAQKALSSRLSVPLFDGKEEKPKVLRDMRFYGYIITRSRVSIVSMVYEPALTPSAAMVNEDFVVGKHPLPTASIIRSFDQTCQSSQFVIRHIQEINVEEADDLRKLYKMHVNIMKWATNHCQAYVKNLHKVILGESLWEDCILSNDKLEAYWRS